MASVGAQCIENINDRIIYTYPAAEFTQVPVSVGPALTPGLKTLVNNAASTSFIVPASGNSARYFIIDWVVSCGIVQTNNLTATSFTAKIEYMKLFAGSLNYDGRTLQTLFYAERVSNIYSGSQLRAINISNISIEPKINLTDYISNSAVAQVQPSASSYSIIAYMQPVVTFYKK